MFDHLKRLLNKAPESTQKDPNNQTLPRHAEDDYRHHTAHMRVLEEILIDRMGTNLNELKINS